MWMHTHCVSMWYMLSLASWEEAYFFFFHLGCESYPVGSICSSDSTLQKNKAQSLSLSAKGCMINI